MWAPISTNSIIMNDEQRLLFLSSQHTDEIHFQFLICLVEIRVLQLSWIKLEQFDVLSIARYFQINIYCVSAVCLFQRDRAPCTAYTVFVWYLFAIGDVIFTFKLYDGCWHWRTTKEKGNAQYIRRICFHPASTDFTFF